MHRSSTIYKQNSPKQIVDVRSQQEMDHFTVGSVIMDYGLVSWPEAMDLFLTNMQIITSLLVDWSGVDYL